MVPCWNWSRLAFTAFSLPPTFAGISGHVPKLTATPWNTRDRQELLLGFLIAMAVLGPVFVIYFVLGLEFERLKAFASLPLDALLFAFGQFAAYRARRYRLTCTVWRGVRFWMTGSGWSDAWRSVLWGLLLIPILSAALERYKLGHTLTAACLAGSRRRARSFLKSSWVWLLGLWPVSMVLGGGMAAVIIGHASGRPSGGATGVILLGGLFLVALPFMHSVRRARS